MNIRNLFFFLFFIISGFTYSQSVELPVDYVRRKNLENNKDLKAEGSKYLNEDFQNGKIIFNNKEIDAKLRYNIITDNFELKDNSDQEIVLITPSDQIELVIGTKSFSLKNYINAEGINAVGYFEVLNEGPINLLKKYRVTYHEAEPAINSYSQDKPARYSTSTDYYLAENNKVAQKIRRLRKKDILNFLNSEKANKFTKENKLKLKTEKEIIELLNFLNNSQ